MNKENKKINCIICTNDFYKIKIKNIFDNINECINYKHYKDICLLCIMKMAKVKLPNLKNVYYKIICPKCKNCNMIFSNDIIDIYNDKSQFKYENYYLINDDQDNYNTTVFIDKILINETYKQQLKILKIQSLLNILLFYITNDKFKDTILNNRDELNNIIIDKNNFEILIKKSGKFIIKRLDKEIKFLNK